MRIPVLLRWVSCYLVPTAEDVDSQDVAVWLMPS